MAKNLYTLGTAKDVHGNCTDCVFQGREDVHECLRFGSGLPVCVPQDKDSFSYVLVYTPLEMPMTDTDAKHLVEFYKKLPKGDQ